MPAVSVIIPFFDQPVSLARCIEALKLQTMPPDRYEVIVVDNGSRVEQPAIREKFPDVRFTYEKKPGSYAARNRGIDLAEAEILAFIDADCVPSTTWLERGVCVLSENPEVGIVGGHVSVFLEHGGRPTAVELHQSITAFRQHNYIRELKFALTANLFTRRDVVERNGKFEARLYSGGDAEWCQRFHSSGGKLHYARGAVVAHPARRTFRELARQRRRTAGGRFQRRSGVGYPPHSLIDPQFSYDAPLRRMASYTRHPGLRTSWDKARFAAVELVLYAVAKLETIRLRLGGRPCRW